MGWKFFNSSGAERAARPASVVNAICSLTRSVVQSIPFTTWTTVTFDVEAVKTVASMHSGSGSQIVIPVTGRYLIEARTHMPQPHGWRVIKNGNTATPIVTSAGTTAGAPWFNATNETTAPGTGIVALNAGDTIELQIYLTGTSNQNLMVDSESPFFSAVLLDGALVSYVEVSKSLVGQELAYVERVTNLTLTTGYVAVVTAPSLTFDGLTKICLEFWSARIDGNTVAQVGLFEDGTQKGLISYHTGSIPIYGKRVFTPAAGSHVYDVRAAYVGTSGLVNAGDGLSSNYEPTFLRITRAA